VQCVVSIDLMSRSCAGLDRGWTRRCVCARPTHTDYLSRSSVTGGPLSSFLLSAMSAMWMMMVFDGAVWRPLAGSACVCLCVA